MQTEVPGPGPGLLLGAWWICAEHEEKGPSISSIAPKVTWHKVVPGCCSLVPRGRPLDGRTESLPRYTIITLCGFPSLH